MSEPTKAAMSAADRVIHHISTSIVYSDESVAEIIDRETWLPELAAALRRISEMDYTRAATNGMAFDAVKIATDALRKAGEL